MGGFGVTLKKGDQFAGKYWRTEIKGQGDCGGKSNSSQKDFEKKYNVGGVRF